MRRRLPTSILCALALIATMPAQGEAEHGKVFGKWKVICEQPGGAQTRHCHIMQNLRLKGTKQQLLETRIGYGPGQDTATVFFISPLGLWAGYGIEFQIDNQEAIRLPFEVCRTDGCHSVLKLDDDLLSTMKKADKAQVAYANLQRQRLVVPISLEGFTAALRHIRATK